jgi:hypothetical protein
MTLILSLSVIVFLKSMPVCFGLNSWNLVDLEQEINNDTEHKRNKSFLMLYNYNKNKYLQLVYLSPTPPPGGRGYNIIYHIVTPFSPGRRGQGDEVKLSKCIKKVDYRFRQPTLVLIKS